MSTKQQRKRAGRIGIGIIGCGTMGQIHAQSYADVGGCELIGFTNRTKDKADKLAARFHATSYDSVSALLADPRIDAVSICSSQQVHAEQILQAAKAGKHVLCEKPLALTPQELEAIERAVAGAGITFMVAHQLPHHPVVHVVKRAMPRLGRCFHIDMEMAFRIKGHEGRCWQNLRDGGFFMELGVHLAHLASHFMGPIDHASAHTLRIDPRRATEDYTHCLMQFRSKAVGSLIVSANHRTQRQGLLIGRILGERGRIDFTIYPYGRSFNQATLTLDRGKSVFVPDAKTQRLQWKSLPSPSKTFPGFFDVYQRQAQSFLNAVKTGAAPAVPLADARRAVEVVFAAYNAQRAATEHPSFEHGSGPYEPHANAHPLLGETGSHEGTKGTKKG